MKRLFFASLLCGTLAQAGTGCVVVTEEDPVVDGVFDVQWFLTEGPTNEPTAACGDGVTAEIVAKDTFSGEEYSAVYDCQDFRGQTGLLPGGEYDVWVNIFNGPDIFNDDLIAQSVAPQRAVIDIDGSAVPLDFEFPAGAYISLTWDIDDGQGPGAQCEDLNADGVSVLATLVGPNTAIDDVYNCSDYAATTPQVLVGEYFVTVNLLSGQESLNEATTEDNFFLEFGNQVYDLGNFAFTLI